MSIRPFLLSHRLTRLAISIAATIVALISCLTGLAPAADRLLDPARFWFTSRPASGKIVIVELDAASAAAIKRWPWPRHHYAQAVDKLRIGGAGSIVFDVDFSSPSSVDGDAAFADALARSGGLVALPTFSQQAESKDRRSIDALPLPAFRQHVSLVSVSIAPDADGTIRSAPFGTITRGRPRPSLSAYVANRSGTADRFFAINYAIDQSTVPRLSFIDVINGRFKPADVRGRQVIIGATAVEMGDRYATPRFGVLPGVVIQALAAETLLDGSPVSSGQGLAVALALMLSLPSLWMRSRLGWALTSMLSTLSFVAVAIILQQSWHINLPIGGGLTLLFTAALFQLALRLGRRMETERLTDPQTGLPNRAAMLGLPAGGGASAVAVLQITNLESLIAVLGPDGEADIILRLAERAQLYAAHGIVYRTADRLLALELAAEQEAEGALAGLKTVMLQPVEVKGRRVDAAVTLGLAGGDRRTGLIQAALAAEHAGATGKFWHRFDRDQAALNDEVSLMGELDRAISDRQLRVYYQPKLAIRSRRIVSCEALVRWDHPERGMIGPDRFIQLAEQTERIAPLTLYVIGEVLQDLARGRQRGIEVTAAVNVSARLLTSAEFNDALCLLLARGIAPATSLVFEVTESFALADSDAAAQTLEGYRQLGIAISIDDYGTGQSTLSYLRHLPVSELKIDRSFVQHAHVNSNDAVLVRSTVQMAHELGLKVVAEGVETEECLDFLARIGCDMAQGYLISKPIPAEPFERLLQDGARRVA